MSETKDPIQSQEEFDDALLRLRLRWQTQEKEMDQRGHKAARGIAPRIGDPEGEEDPSEGTSGCC